MTRVTDRRGSRHRVSCHKNTRLRRHWRRYADADAVPILRTDVCAFLSMAGVGSAVLDSVRLGLSEALTNAVQHSYVDRETAGDVVVTADVLVSQVQVVVADAGSGFAPRLDSPGLGLGLPMIAEVCDGLEILDA